ncbi:hypothetical protein LEP1GSC108_0330 [Leptospira weilii str. UI 13098]|uniref:Uncharacterized protein n=1 Tax=Leptospira weilii str. UI 13098 TaxID=1088542 RepID=M6QRK2_9LEPT|nr:hypothetical protein LEP1GSC108_0330 [Leptospira weilii str. UI 13098]
MLFENGKRSIKKMPSWEKVAGMKKEADLNIRKTVKRTFRKISSNSNNVNFQLCSKVPEP